MLLAAFVIKTRAGVCSAVERSLTIVKLYSQSIADGAKFDPIIYMLSYAAHNREIVSE
jgi:hypothetical protein